MEEIEKRTPIWTANNSIVPHACGGIARNSEIGQLYRSILIREDIGTFDVSVNNSLVVKVNQSLQHLRNVHRNQTLWELAEALGYIVQGTVLAEPKSYQTVAK